MLIDDLRFASRLIRERPGTSLLVMAALVLGIGANTAVFSVVNAVLLRPLPVFEPGRVVRMYSKINRTGASVGTSYPEYLDWKTQARSFEAMTAMRAFSFYLSGNGSPEHLEGASVSPSTFKVFGVKTVLGRDFAGSDDRPEAQRTVILNDSFWARRFGRNPDVLGRSLRLDDHSYIIIGVLQATPLAILRYTDVWAPNAFFLDQKMQSRDSRYYFPTGRLKSHVTLAQAQTEMDTIAARLAAQYPASNKRMGIRLWSLVDQLTAGGREPVSFLFTVSSLIFVLACVNILIVFLSSTAERRKELSIRLALGCSRSRLLRQLLVQALMLVGAGSVLGMVLAKFGLVFFLRRFPNAVSRFRETTIDYRVIGFMIALALLTTLLATIVPAWYASRLNINSELKGETTWPASSRLRVARQGGLIVFEVALASALSLVCGLLIRSFYEVAKVDLGFNPHHVLSFQINLPTSYKGAGQSAFYQQALGKLSQLPGVLLASGIESLPLTTQGNVVDMQADAGSPLNAERPVVEYESALPGWLKTMGMPVLAGRDFTDTDRPDATPVVIVDNVLATKFWPGQSPIGKRLRFYETAESQDPWREVVGVVKEVKHFGPESKVRFMQVYVPEYQVPTPVLSFVIDTALPEAVVKKSAEKAIHDLDAELPLDNFQSMDTLLDGYLASRKVSLLLLSVFAGIAVLLGALGIYGVISNSVVRRRRELAIRMALGATPRRTMVLVARLGMIFTLAGIVLGIVLVLTFTRFLSSFLFGVKSLDPTVYLLSAGLILALGVIAVAAPARSILSLDPQTILRE